MEHDILSAKLRQLDDGLQRLHGRIEAGQRAGRTELRREIDALKAQCRQEEAALLRDLERSQSPLAPVLAQSFRQAEQLVRHAEAGLQEVCSQAPDEETRAEEKILLAEYALDFAQGAANRALLVCMNAMDADLLRRQERIQ